MRESIAATLFTGFSLLAACSSTGDASGASSGSGGSSSSSASAGGGSPSSASSSSTTSSSTTSSSSASSSGAGGNASGTGSIVTVSGYQVIVKPRQDNGALGPAAPWDLKGIAWSPFGANEPFSSTGAIYSTHGAEDVALMAAAHINTVRTYGPFERNAAGLAVLDELHKHGMMAAMTVFAAFDDAAYVDAVNTFKDHPAILMWVVGNEWNYNKLYSNHTFDECAQKVNDVAAAIKALDPDHPVATCYGEVPKAADLAKVPAAEVWGLNLYPYLDFGNRFTDWKGLSSKPFFVSEYGADAFNSKSNAEDQDSQSTALSTLTGQIRQNLSAQDPAKVCLGGCPYEWNDEWWKSGDPAAQDNSGFANQGVYPDGMANEEWWGIVTAKRVPRKAYTTLQSLYP